MNIVVRKFVSACRRLNHLLHPHLLRFRCKRRIPQYYSIAGWLSETEALGLYDLARSLKNDASVLEIGVWQGKSTYCLARGLSSGMVTVIDPFNAAGGADTDSEAIYRRMQNEKQLDLLETFQRNLERGKVASKVKTLRGYSQQFVGSVPAIDLLFIDGDHSIEGCSFDFDAYQDAVRPGGYLLFHDYDPSRSNFGPTWVIHNKVLPSGRYKPLKVLESLWIGQRT
jgi:predicted O-methyltransferase YrrM